MVVMVKMPPCKSQDNDHCINPPEVHKVLWKDFGKTWPAAYEFLKKFQMDAGEQTKLMLAIEKQGQDEDKVTGDWVDKNQSVWQPWVNAATGS